MGDGITKAERRSEFGTLERNILLIDALPVEFDEIFERAEVGRIVTGGSGVFDVMKGKFGCVPNLSRVVTYRSRRKEVYDRYFHVEKVFFLATLSICSFL